MQFYFLNAKAVGDLTGLFLAQLDEQLGAKGRRFALPTLKRRPKHLNGFTIDRGRLSIPNDHWLSDNPVRLVELFALAAREGLEIHPNAMRLATRDARLADTVREQPIANALFLEVLTARDRPDLALRWMNEAGVFGRFVPDFGRVVAQMQFDMYHHYTVDEHSIRAIGLLSRIERGELADDHPLSTALFKQIASRRLLYVAVLLHDIAKGRGGDHSELGAEVALELCPRFGLDEAETETVAWLVRHHLLLSNTAFRRDITDPKTVEDFVRIVQSPERLRLLLILTVVDIRAVGPTTWNDWKRQLAPDIVRHRRGAVAAGSQTARPAGAGSGPTTVIVGRFTMEAVGRESACSPAPGQLLAGRTPGMAASQCPPGRFGGGPFRRSRTLGDCPARCFVGHDPNHCLRPRPGRPFLPHLRCSQPSGGIDHRRANSHDSRSYGTRQSVGHRWPRQSL
jgi:[protein-PII] uridylyltransferase